MGAIFKIFGISDSPIFAMEMNDSRMGFLPAPLHPLRERIHPPQISNPTPHFRSSDRMTTCYLGLVIVYNRS